MSECARRLPVVVMCLWALTSGPGMADQTTWPGPKGPWIDEDQLTEVHKARIARLGEDGHHFESAWWLALEHLLWPTQAELAGALNDAARTAAARADCARELGWILRPEYVPTDFAEHLAAVRKYGRNDSDFLFTRCRVGRWQIQVIHSGHVTGILALPLGPVAPREAGPDYALEVAKKLFVPPRQKDEPVIRARGGMVGDLAYGSIGNPNIRSKDDPPVGPGPWYGTRYITNGHWVFLGPAKYGLAEDIDLRGKALVPKPPPMDRAILLFK